MHIGNLLLFGIIVSVAAVLTDSVEPTRRTTDLKQLKGVNEKRSLSAPQTVTAGDRTKSTRNAAKTKSAATTTTTAALKPTATRQSKDIKIRKESEESRGKRTLFNFGNAGENFFYPNVANAPSFNAANRRSDYEGRAFYPVNDGRFYNEPNSLGHFPSDLGVSYSNFPQYLEAPEPIIEIIIKDSNETLPINTTPLPPKKKKKKEKVQVFYVNYKKDANNKLHLETPIASLNNDDEGDVRDGEEENERHIDYPSGAVTPPTPLRTTTLRTVIHPDSEKYHSNGGIRVSFGSEDKSQTGHSVEEANAESVQRQVVAVPVPASPHTNHGDPFSGFNSLTESYFANQRTISEQKRLVSASGSSLQSQPQVHYQADQQLPAYQTGNYFRSPYPSLTAGSASGTTPNFFPKQGVATTPAPTPHFYRKQQQQQQQASTFGASTKSVAHSQQQQASKSLPQPQAQTQQLPRKPTSAAQQTRQQSHYYVNFNQQYPQQQQTTQQQSNQQFQHSAGFSHNYQYDAKRQQQQQTSASAAAIFAPTVPPKVQDSPFRQSLAPYQPIKFRPTPPPTNQIKSVPIPAKLENSHYQQAAHHQHHHNQQQVTAQKQQKQQYYTQQQYPQQQQHQQHYTFNHQQQQFVQTPPTSNRQQQLQQQSVYFKKQQQHQQQPQQPQFNGGQKSHNQHNGNVLPQNQAIRHDQVQYQQQQQQHHQQYQLSHQQLSTSLNNLHTALKAQPSKETELLQSVPKYEQHITETIHQQQQKALQQQQQQQQQQQVTNTYNEFNYPQNNQVIHDIPAPNLGPSGPQQHQQQQQQQQYFYQTQQYQQQQYQPQQQQQHYQQHTSAQSAGSSSAGQHQEFTNFVTTPRSNSNNNNNQLFSSSTPAPEYELTTDGRKIMIVTPMPPSSSGYNHYVSNDYQQQQQVEQHNQPQQQHVHYQQQQLPSSPSSSNSPWSNNFSQQQQHSIAPTNFGVSTFHANAFQELEKRKHSILRESRPQEQQQQQQQQQQPRNTYNPAGTGAGVSTGAGAGSAPGSAAGSAGTASGSGAGTAAKSSPSGPSSQSQASNDAKVSKTLLELPEEVPEDLRQHLISSGILGNAQISVLDYDKVGDVALENLPAEHLQHFYGAGGGAQISESKQVLTVVKPDGENVRKQATKSLPEQQKLDVKVVRFNENNERTVTKKHVRTNATIVPPVDIADRQYNRYLPIKINGAQFPLPDAEELRDKKVVSVVVLAPVEAQPYDTFDPYADVSGKTDARSHRDAADGREVKFLGGDLIRILLKKPTKENYKRWLEKEARTDVEQQAVVLLVARPMRTPGEQEIFMYDIVSGAVNKLNGELSSAFVSVAEENASSEDLEHASTLDPADVENMMQKRRR